MAEDYHVVTEDLRGHAERLGQIATLYENATGWVHGINMGRRDLGVLGQWAKLPDIYTRAKDTFENVFREDAKRLRDAESALIKVKKTYEDKDAEWYRRFGYTDS